jgi:DNA-binding CsgD family transcriptional regulator
MLETIREYGLEQLCASGEEAAVRQRHAEVFLALAAQAAPHVEDGDQLWLDRLEPEREDLRAALAWLSERGAIQQCLQLVGDLRGLWFHRGSWSDAWAQLEAVLTLPGAHLPTAARAYALATAGVVAIWRGDAAGSISLNSEALAICQALGERAQQPWLFVSQGIAAANLGDSERAVQYWEQSLTLAREVGDDVNAARSLANISARTFGPQNLDRRQAMNEEALALARAAGHPATIHLCLTGLVTIAFDRGAYRQAALGLQETLAISASSGWQWQLAVQLAAIARLAWVTGQAECALHLLGAHDALRERTGMPAPSDEGAQHDEVLTALRAVMDGDTYAAARTAGQSMALDEAIAMAAGVLAAIVAADSLLIAPPAAAQHGLSPRELEVLRLIAAGRSNREMAEALYLSQRTVERHIANLYLKIDAHSKAEATAYARRHQLA